jgi:transcriptional regulator PpsR
MRNDLADLTALSPLAQEVAQLLVSLASDVVLIIDEKGVIQRVAFSAAEPMSTSVGDWVGRPWIETVTQDTRQKAEQLLRDVAATGMSRLRQINHPSPLGLDIPIGYTAVRLGDRGPLLAVGRDLRAVSVAQQRFIEAQQAMERDYWKTRQAETRYRLLFDIAADAILMVDAETLRVVEANRSAGRLFCVSPEDLIGTRVTDALDRGSQREAEALLSDTHRSGRPTEFRARLAASGAVASVSATLCRSAEATLLLVRVRFAYGGTQKSDATGRLGEFVKRAPDAIVITDADGRIVLANPASLGMLQLGSVEHAQGRLLGDWLGRAGHDWATIFATLKDRGALRLAVQAPAELGSLREIELSATLLPEDGDDHVGFILRATQPGTAEPLRLGQAFH